MKKNSLIKAFALVLMLVGAVRANAQIDLGSILGGLTGKNTTEEKASSASNLISGLSSIFSKDKQASTNNLVGTWEYSEPAIIFESDNILAKAGANIASNKIEGKLQEQLSKFGFAPAGDIWLRRRAPDPSAVGLTHEFLASRVNKLCDISESRGITLTYENVHWAYFSVPEYFEKLSPLCPRLGATLDIKQAMQARLDYFDFLKVMGSRLKTVHLCNYTESGKLVMPHSKEGVFDFKLLFRRLKDAGFDGACLIEVYSSCYENFDEIAQSLNYLNDIKEGL